MTDKIIGQVLVAIQLAGMGMSVYALRYPADSSPFSMPVLAAGLLLGMGTIVYNRIGNFGIHPEPLPGTKLITTGPYRWIRHPMYLSVILMLTGLALRSQHWLGYTGLLLASIAVLWKSFLEERYLESTFDQYEEYKSRTKRIIPFLL